MCIYYCPIRFYSLWYFWFSLFWVGFVIIVLVSACCKRQKARRERMVGQSPTVIVHGTPTRHHPVPCPSYSQRVQHQMGGQAPKYNNRVSMTHSSGHFPPPYPQPTSYPHPPPPQYPHPQHPPPQYAPPSDAAYPPMEYSEPPPGYTPRIPFPQQGSTNFGYAQPQFAAYGPTQAGGMR